MAKRIARHWFAALSMMPACLPACAALWALDSSASVRLEAGDNPSLAAQSGEVVFTQTLGGTLNAWRQTETLNSRVELSASALSAPQRSGGQRVDGRLSLSQSWVAPLDLFSAAASLQQNTTLDTRISSVDVALGRGQRRTGSVSGGWSRSLSERLSTGLQLALSRTGYGSELPDAVDFRSDTLGGDLSYRLSETTSAKLQISGSNYRGLGVGAGRSQTAALSLGYSSAIDESSSLSLSLGQYRTQRSATRSVIVCPLPISFCSSGLVQPVIAQQAGSSVDRGLQFSGSYQHRLGQTSEVALTIGRQQSPSGAGVVVRSDSLSLVANRALSPSLGLALNFLLTRSSYGGVADGPRPVLHKLALTVSRQLAEDLNLVAGFESTRSFDGRSGVGARSNSLAITLKYEGPKLFATR